MKPWEDPSYFYAVMAAILSALVIFTVISEFFRGGRVIAGKTGQNFFAAMIQLSAATRAATADTSSTSASRWSSSVSSARPSTKKSKKKWRFGDKINIGPYTLVCQSYTQDDNPNYANEWAIINVFRGGKQITTMYPERRFYKASGQPQTMPHIYPSFREDLFLVNDLYLVYEGKNETTGRPIIKAHLNPLVPWIWIGLIIMVFGTVIALVPNSCRRTGDGNRASRKPRTRERVTG